MDGLCLKSQLCRSYKLSPHWPRLCLMVEVEEGVGGRSRGSLRIAKPSTVLYTVLVVVRSSTYRVCAVYTFCMLSGREAGKQHIDTKFRISGPDVKTWRRLAIWDDGGGGSLAIQVIAQPGGRLSRSQIINRHTQLQAAAVCVCRSVLPLPRRMRLISFPSLTCHPSRECQRFSDVVDLQSDEDGRT